MSSNDVSPTSWEFLLTQSQGRIASDEGTGKSVGVPGGVEFGTPARVSELKSSPSLSESAVEDVAVVLLSKGPGVEMCVGKIGSDNSRFCTASCDPGKVTCRFASHATKVVVSFPAYYISASKPNTAFCQPCLPIPDNGFPNVILETLAGKRPQAEWGKVFATAQTAATLSFADQMDMVARVERFVPVGPTPIKIRARVGNDTFAGVEKEGTDYDGDTDVYSQSGGMEVYSDAIVAEGSTFDNTMMHVATYWNPIINATRIQRESFVEFESCVRSVLEEVDDKVVNLATTVGNRPQGSTLPLTLWATVCKHAEQLESSFKQFTETKAVLTGIISNAENEVVNVKHTLEASVLPIVSNLHASIDRLRNASVATPASIDIQAQINELKENQRVMVSQIHLTQTNQPNPSSSLATNMEMAQMRQALDSLRFEVQTLRNATPPVNMGVPGSYNSDAGNFLADIGSIREDIAALQSENLRLRSELSSDNISFGGHHFLSDHSYVEFVRDHFPSGYYGFCFDFISLLECSSDRNRTTTEALKSMHIIGKAGFTDPAEARIQTSFGTIFPEVFGEENDKKDPTKKMGSITDLNEWDPPTNRAGRKTKINDFLLNFKRTTDAQITAKFGSQSVATLLFRHLVQSTWSFWEAYTSWVTSFERTMCNQLAGDNPSAYKASIWNLICWMTHSMFVEMSVRRAPGLAVSSLHGSDNAIEKCAAILHGTLGAHKFMAELVDKDFNRHPIFGATMSEFLLTTKAANLSVDMLTGKIKRIEEVVKGLQAERDKGHNRIKVPAGVLIKTEVVIVDVSYPCWWTAARAVDLNVSRIWLTSYTTLNSCSLSEWCHGVPVDVGSVVSDEFLSALNTCSFLLVGGSLPPSLQHLWSIPSLQIVLTTRPLNVKPPTPWLSTVQIVDHSLVGGVTDGKFPLHVFVRPPLNVLDCTIVYDETPRQDLRGILKSGISGRQSTKLVPPSPVNASSLVQYCGKGVILDASLWPIRHPSMYVRTKWHNSSWIERPLSSFEQLLAVDVPEKLIRSISDEAELESIFTWVSAPGKVLYAALCHFAAIICQPCTTRKRKRDVEPMTSLKRFIPPVKPTRAQKVIEPWPPTRYVNSESPWTQQLLPISEDFQVLPVSMDSSPIPPTILVSPIDSNTKATKHDDAVVRTSLWDSYLHSQLPSTVQSRDTVHASIVLRSFVLCFWKRRVTRSYFAWARSNGWDPTNGSTPPYSDNARDCISRAANASWWSWDAGSSPFFWRWPCDYISQVRDGVPPWFTESVTPWTRKQRGSPQTDRHAMVSAKLRVILDKCYIEDGTILSLMSFFDVPKGSDDIRMVYDGSASGLNSTLWAPWFPLPTVDCLLRSLEPGFCMADNDVGEMFHNFPLHASLRQYCGLDLSLYFDKTAMGWDQRGRLWKRWNRLAMGLRNSPYCAVQGMMMAREVILGNRHDTTGNVFHWSDVRLNLPGSVSYSPSHAWVTKIRFDGVVAADIFIYVDDIRCSAPTPLEAWQASQRTSSILANLGLQDAARKRRDPGLEPGAWTGSVVWTSAHQLSVLTTQDKWDKTKSQLCWIDQHIGDPLGMDIHMLKSIRGFLVYVSRTYTSMVPYLKGLHATIDSWRPGRNQDGWKLPLHKHHQNEDESVEIEFWDKFGDSNIQADEPLFVFPVRRLRNDLNCLIKLTSSAKPPLRQARMNTQARVMYGFGDASKQGFGASIELPDKQIHWRFGQWRLEDEYAAQTIGMGLSFMEERSSNYRELRNLVEALESAFSEGLLHDREIFMFTDNSTAEAAFFKGTSSSELLFDLILRLRTIEMSGICVIHMIHVAGTRMICQGTDGLSRGDKSTGVMAGESMLSFVPLHLSVTDRSPNITQWISQISDVDGECGEGLRFLNANDWPEPLTSRNTYVWTPPPAAADVAAEYMAQSIHKRPNSTHIFICPRLMTSRWQRIVRKTSDLFCFISIGCPIWGTSQHEPLILALSLPLSREKPWKHGRTPYCEHLGKILPKMFVEDFTGASTVLRKCIIRAWSMAEL